MSRAMRASSAEVGSSAISTRGCVASASAIAMRWRWPPENWCGKLRSAAAGSGNCTRVNNASASRRARSRDRPRITRTVSISCAPTVRSGCSAASGSCGIQPSTRPRRPTCSREPSAISRPSSDNPPRERNAAGSRPSSASALRLLPLPLSPTRPRHSPACNSSVSGPSRRRGPVSMVRSRSSSTAGVSIMPPRPRAARAHPASRAGRRRGTGTPPASPPAPRPGTATSTARCRVPARLRPATCPSSPTARRR